VSDGNLKAKGSEGRIKKFSSFYKRGEEEDLDDIASLKGIENGKGKTLC